MHFVWIALEISDLRGNALPCFVVAAAAAVHTDYSQTPKRIHAQRRSYIGPFIGHRGIRYRLHLPLSNCFFLCWAICIIRDTFHKIYYHIKYACGRVLVLQIFTFRVLWLHVLVFVFRYGNGNYLEQKSMLKSNTISLGVYDLEKSSWTLFIFSVCFFFVLFLIHFYILVRSLTNLNLIVDYERAEENKNDSVGSHTKMRLQSKSKPRPTDWIAYAQNR